MKIKIFSLLLPFCFFTSIAVTPGNNVIPPSLIPPEDVCILSPPSSLNVGLVGTTWADLSWPAVPGADHYLIKTYEAASGILVDNGTAPFNATAYRVNNLAGGVTYYSRIWSVCQNGQQSLSFSQSNNYDVIIIDYVSTGYNGSSQGAGWMELCELPLLTGNPIQDCEFDWSSGFTYFYIDAPDQQFFRVNVASNVVKMYADVSSEHCCGDEKGMFRFEAEGNHHVKVYYNTKLIARLSAARPSVGGPGLLFREDGVSGDNNMDISIYKFGPQFSGDPTDRDDAPAPGNLPKNGQVSASPNPFTNFLEVQIPYATEEEAVNISLYDLQGRLVMTQKSQGGPPISFLSTEGLLPGLYMLRVDTGDRTETVKVVKTQ